ncbi:methylglyoxal synthase, putative [Babesia ovata]|uniref:Methylglyoxal synthase, putative n=1 Tax=Babesia ovata TaxID=189622 RepID=A0A2H6KIZ7_9APIC|nr:methylglyoxal synthase, putative [Babesia ovata]GBE62964.1 methylglyoxal synthase, putative [Babesia ovata]
MVIITCKILFSKNEFLLLTTCQAWRIILPNVIVNLLLELMFETTFNSSKLSVELLHKLILAKHNWTLFLLNLPSRLVNRRLGCSLDLCLSFSVESLNGGGKFGNLSLQILLDFLKVLFKPLNLLPHRLQLTVHGLGGAFIFAGGRDAGRASRLFQLLVEIIYSRFNLVQNFAKLVDA